MYASIKDIQFIISYLEYLVEYCTHLALSDDDQTHPIIKAFKQSLNYLKLKKKVM